MNNATNVHRRDRSSTSTRLRRLGITAAVVASSLVGSLHVDAADSGAAKRPTIATERSIARFEGRQIDLAKDWEDAQACWVDETGAATCYRSETQMDRALVAAGHDLAATNAPTERDKQEGLRGTTCSSALRLYRDNSYSGSVLYLSQRGHWTNMSWYGFDNVVSSYRVGGCSTAFKSGSNGSGTTYWGDTWAWAAKSSMTGWNNVLSSVYIY